MIGRFARCFVQGLIGAALACAATAAQTETLWLSGRDRATAVPWDFFCTAGHNADRWVKLPVPSQWDALGYGTLNYGHDDTSAPIEQGRYRHTFEVPAAWRDRRVFLVFDGAMTDTTAHVNGQLAGPTHQGGFYPFRYEVTSLLHPGAKNLLEVTVDKHSANESVNRAERQADYWVFGGIYRPVRLEALPTEFIARAAIDARADGNFSARVFFDGADRADSIAIELLDPSGRPVAASTRAPVTRGTTQANLTLALPNPLTWTAETPHLYSAVIQLLRGTTVLHEIRSRFGFRTIEVRPSEGIFVNGRRVLLKGVNRHSFRPDTGRTLAESDHRADIALIKHLNMNAVRMSHYPPDEQFLELCDELGLYVLDELAGWQHSYDTETGKRLVESMVTRDVNHPSILFWDNGNEGGWNTELDAEFSRWDPQNRIVLHPWDTFNGINAVHYPDFEALSAAATGISFHRVPKATGKARYRQSDAPAVLLPTEIMHGLYDGGMGTGFEDYWAVIRNGRSAGGCFLWVLADEGLRRPDTGQIDVAEHRAPDGIVGPYHELEASAHTIREIWSPVTVREKELPTNFNGTLTIENHYDFTRTAGSTFSWELRSFPLAGESGGTKLMATGTLTAPDLAPGESGPLHLTLPENWQSAGALALRIQSAEGRELTTRVWPLSGADHGTSAPNTGTPAARATRDGDRITLQAGSFTARFDARTGYLEEISRGDRVLPLKRGPRPAAGETNLAALSIEQEGASVHLRARYDGALTTADWTLLPDGTLRCDYHYRATGPHSYLGIVFDLPADQVQAKRWLGDGPYRVWQNRRRGVSFGLWENDFNDTVTGFRGWTYPEFQGCFSGVRWMELRTPAGRLLLHVRTPNLFVQVLSPEFPDQTMTRGARADLPAAGLGLLHAIPAIGNKFFPAENTGPLSRIYEAEGDYRGSFELQLLDRN